MKNKLKFGIRLRGAIMEVDKLKKWLDVAQQFQTDKFWNQIFDEKGTTNPGKNSSLNPFPKINDLFPKCDLYEVDNELIVEAEVPGLMKEDLQISINQQLLIITGEFHSLKLNRKYFLKERVSRKFKKELTLPYPIVVNKIRTEIQNGILVIAIPFQHEEGENIPITFDHSNPE